MLVLTRKQNESILIGNDIRLVVLGISGDKVRLGIEAPSAVKILRAETLEQTRQQNRLAADSGMEALRRLELESCQAKAEAGKNGKEQCAEGTK